MQVITCSSGLIFWSSFLGTKRQVNYSNVLFIEHVWLGWSEVYKYPYPCPYTPKAVIISGSSKLYSRRACSSSPDEENLWTRSIETYNISITMQGKQCAKYLHMENWFYNRNIHGNIHGKWKMTKPENQAQAWNLSPLIYILSSQDV